MEVEVVVDSPLQVTVTPSIGCPFNVTCPYTETVGDSDNADGAAVIARRVATASVFTSTLNIILFNIDSPII
jgi:hypothetical protein